MSKSPSLLLVGCGNMGGALLAQWKKSHPAGIKKFFVIDRAAKGANIHESITSLPKNCAPDIIVFAVKPQELATLLPAYAKRFGTTPLYVSVAAGKTLAFFAKHLGARAAMVRAMPNTPALIGEGITALVASASVSKTQKHIAVELLRTVGDVLWVDDEKHMDIITAISGSGPAYVFLFMEALVAAAMQHGLPAAAAEILVRQTVIGSALLAGENDLRTLRENVTSKGGTTEAALGELMKRDALHKLLQSAVNKAHKRSQQLAKI